MDARTKKPLTEKLLEFELCSPNGYKMREGKIIHDKKDTPIMDEKWLTTSHDFRDLNDLKILANTVLTKHENWQNIFDHHTVSELVDDYRANKQPELEKLLTRERDNARWDNAMALFSSIAYLTKEQITGFLKALEIESEDFLIINDKDEKTDIQGFVFRFKTDKEYTIAIHAWRGTDSMGDWLINLNAGLPFLRAMHRGIKGVLEKSMPEILKFQEDEPDTINILTGHSLGGGLANASVPMFLKKERKIARLTTFGAEKSLSKGWLPELANKISAGASRWISHSDPVPYLPPGFDVIGTVYYFNNEKGPCKITHKPPGFWEHFHMWKKERPDSHHDLDCYLFKTRHLAAYLTHILKGRRGEYLYEYPYPDNRGLRKSFRFT